MTVDIAPWLVDSRWPTVPIRYVAKLGTGHTPSRQHPEYWDDCTVPWVTLADVGQLRQGTVDIISNTAEMVSRLGIANSSAVRHPAGTVILSRTASVGFSAILGADMATSQDFATWTCGGQLDASRLAQIGLLNELRVATVSDAYTLRPNVSAPRLGYLATVQSGVTVDASRASSLNDVTLPYLRVANVQAGYLDLREVAEITVPRHIEYVSTLRRGDVLMTEGGDLDKLGRGTVWEGQIDPCLHQNHVFAVRVDMRHLDPYYLALLTLTTHARIHFESTGTKTTNLASTSSSKIRDLRVPLPALPEQRAIVKATRSALASIEALGAAIARQRTLLTERRQALIAAAVTGQF